MSQRSARPSPLSRPRLAVLAPLLTLAFGASSIGCDGGGDDDVRYPGGFAYVCTGGADAFCTAGRAHAQLPAGIAAGTSFGLTFVGPRGSSPLTIDLLGTTRLEQRERGVLVASRPGHASVFARTEDGLVGAFVTLRVVVVSSLALDGLAEGATLRPGESRWIVAQPLDASGGILAGAGSYAWETSDTSIATIDTTEDGLARGGATLRAVAPGLARVRAVFGSVTATVDVLVGGP